MTAAKIDLNRVSMPKQAPEDRIFNFDEVAQGYTHEQAVTEAKRCLACPKKPCVEGCPVGVDIPEFIKELVNENLEQALAMLKARNSLPAICGRVCPQESQCEAKCSLGKKGAPVAIGRLERYIADWELADVANRRAKVNKASPTGKMAAIVGAGPAGLTAAADLAKLGHTVFVFEALHVAGGVLVYGIPEFRLPKGIVAQEVEYVESLGARVRLNCVIGKTFTLDELMEHGFQAVFLGSGGGLPMFLNIPQENLTGVYSANEFLTRANLMKAYLFPRYLTPLTVGDRVAVIGGGNVAMDAARCALRLGAHEVRIIYRRSRAEMPARLEESENAEEEGVIFQFLTNPIAFIGADNGSVKAMKCVEMMLGEPDASGRARPVVKPDSEFTLEVDTAIVALGTTPNPLIPSTTSGLQTTDRGTVVADKETGLTSRDRIWAGGDLTTGSATVISAMGAGKRAAAAMHVYLTSQQAPTASELSQVAER